jgi:glycosyltransferase involved in cell wall biosynthesis
MKVLFVSQEMPPETGWGGIGSYVDVLGEALAEKGVEVHVLSAVHGQLESHSHRGGVTVHRYPLPHFRGQAALPPETCRRTWLPVNVARLVPRLGIAPDIVETPEWMAEGLGLSVTDTVPHVVRLHSSARQLFRYTEQGRRLGGLDGRLSGWLETLSARRANVVISTRANLDEIAAPMRLDPVAQHAIPYPVRLPSPAPMPDDESPRITFVGRLEPRKGPDVLLGAAPHVLAAVPTARFVFVGRDAVAPGTKPSTDWLRQEGRRLGVENALEFTGHLDRQGVAAELRRATVCAFPSRWESFGNVVAEASATGRPVVASAIPSFQELVADGVTGVIASPDDTAAWAAAITELLGDRNRAAAMGEAGATRVARISLPAAVADLTLGAYEHAITRWHHRERAAAAPAWSQWPLPARRRRGGPR